MGKRPLSQAKAQVSVSRWYSGPHSVYRCLGVCYQLPSRPAYTDRAHSDLGWIQVLRVVTEGEGYCSSLSCGEHCLTHY